MKFQFSKNAVFEARVHTHEAFVVSDAVLTTCCCRCCCCC